MQNFTVSSAYSLLFIKVYYYVCIAHQAVTYSTLLNLESIV